MEGNYSLADIAAATGEGCGTNGGLWIFALLILLSMGNGGIFGGNGERNATQADIQRAVDFDTLKSSIAGVSATVRDTAYNQLGEIRDIQNVVNTGFANMQTCCCETQRAIDSVKFDMANYSAAIQANDTANTQKVLDALHTNREADMQNQINQLQIQQALCGIPKINPYGYAMYPTWPAPPFGPVQ